MIREFKIVFIMVIMAVACSKRGESQDELVTPLQLTISPIIQSRATDLLFEVGDRVGLRVVKESDNSLFVDNAGLSYDGSLFVGDVEWYSELDATSTLSAYYPFVNSDSTPILFMVQTDQTLVEAYSASDLMLASKSGVAPSSQAALLVFYHSLSRVVMQIDNQSGKSIEEVIIGGTRVGAIIDVGSTSVEVDSSSSVVEIKASLWDDGTYKAIVVPQSCNLTFGVTFGDGTTMSRELDLVTLLSGGEYLVSVTLLEDNLDVEISDEVYGWDDAGEIPNGEIGDPDEPQEEEKEFEEFDGYFVYHGERYSTATFDNGLTVMVDNMRYVPQGSEVSSDPSDGSGLWYPYSLEIDADLEDASYVATPLTDAESVAKYGLFYSHATAFGQDVTGENYDSFEGTQGICPDGWHIPTSDEWYTLCGDGYQSSSITTAPFYDASVGYGSIQRANELGFNHVYPGAIANTKYNTMSVGSDYTPSSYVELESESIVGRNSLTYYMSSTAHTYYPNSDLACFLALYTSHASAYAAKGSISVMLSYEHYGLTLRCAKDN